MNRRDVLKGLLGVAAVAVMPEFAYDVARKFFIIGHPGEVRPVSLVGTTPPAYYRWDVVDARTVELWRRELERQVAQRSPLFNPAAGLVGDYGAVIIRRH